MDRGKVYWEASAEAYSNWKKFWNFLTVKETREIIWILCTSEASNGKLQIQWGICFPGPELSSDMASSVSGTIHVHKVIPGI